MLTKKEQRLRRSRQTRIRIANQGAVRLSVFRSNLHIYASVISGDGQNILASASTAEKEVREQLGKDKGGNASAAALVGKRIAEKARAAGVEKVAFDRSGFAYHGRGSARSRFAVLSSRFTKYRTKATWQSFNPALRPKQTTTV
jgi:large subunit ribosomal protein L18